MLLCEERFKGSASTGDFRINHFLMTFTCVGNLPLFFCPFCAISRLEHFEQEATQTHIYDVDRLESHPQLYDEPGLTVHLQRKSERELID